MSDNLTEVKPESMQPLVYKGHHVLTTEILAYFYGTKTKNIRKNFSTNPSRFVEGKHYFKLRGEELRDFKRDVTESSVVKIQKNLNVLNLWTERGTARHAKILETDKAWEVFEILEDNYFSKLESEKSYIYFIQVMFDFYSFVKIGFSTNPFKRLKDIQVGCPVKIDIMDFVEFECSALARRCEQSLHRMFADRRSQGEWFTVSPEEFAEFNEKIAIILDVALGEWKMIENNFVRDDNLSNCYRFSNFKTALPEVTS